MNKILFTGITGLLGKYFLIEKPSGYEVTGTYNHSLNFQIPNSFKLDITDKKKTLSFIKKVKPNVVVHAASIGKVDYCESNPDEAYKVNVDGTRNVLEASRKVKAKFLFTSSNAVYDGESPPYNEDSLRNPLDAYGRTKVEAEDLITKSKVPYMIVRLMTMYGWPPLGARSNPVSWIIGELRQRKKVNIVDDIYNNHLSAGQAAEVMWKIIDLGKDKEKYNIAGEDCTSRYDLALKVCKVFNLDASLITPVKNDFFKNIAPRPKNTCFDTLKIKRELKVKPSTISEGLKEMKDGEKT